MIHLCENCGEAEGTVDLYPPSHPGNGCLVCKLCYEDIAATDERLPPLHLHPDYDGEGW